MNYATVENLLKLTLVTDRVGNDTLETILFVTRCPLPFDTSWDLYDLKKAIRGFRGDVL